MTESADQQRARLAYEASLRALEQQQRRVEELRARTGILLPTAAFSASFLGTRAFDGRASATFIVAAFVALVVALIAGVTVLLRNHDLGYSVTGRLLHRRLSGAQDHAAQHHELASLLDRLWAVNQSSISRLNRRFEIAAVALIVQIVCWAAAVGSTLGST